MTDSEPTTPVAPAPIEAHETLQPSPPAHRIRAVLSGVFAGMFLYLFLSSIHVMGSGLKQLGHQTEWLGKLLGQADDPLVALLGSILITAIVQSSSFTTSLIITLVAAGQLQMEAAIYAVMGANIGTSVTNIMVSFGNVRIRRQFRRSFRAAIVHDVFNWLTVVMLFPLEWISSAILGDGGGLITRAANWLAGLLNLSTEGAPNNPLKMLTKPVVEGFKWVSDLVTPSDVAASSVLSVLGLFLLFFSLFMLVKSLKGALLRRIEGLFRRVFFRNDGSAYIVGALTTLLVQSSSVTTSLIVPLAGAGAVKLKRVYPYTLGANLGTTITGVIAASAVLMPEAVTVAIGHVMFNLIGTAVWYPGRRVPLAIARWYGRVAAKSKRYALLFLFGAFLVLPLVGILISKTLHALFG